ncbi:hypothetical protein SEQ01_09110 [Streptococcus equinus]|uniref:transporter n=1 Tax=Streptococcus equinus TaxID=1335 RepID=UPI001141574A|nr:transporter [Streptococcus equinus]GEB10720.1 hypothetical protein SEQ01_09110 [Streptococcus equinus]
MIVINEIIIQLPKKNNHIWLLHLWEHCVVRNFEKKLIQHDLDGQGIIINGATFLDSTSIEIFYSISSLREVILSIVQMVIKDIPREIIEHEISIISDEISYVDINDEEKAVYDGLKITENDNILNLYKNINLSVEEVIQKFSQLVEDVKIADFSDNRLTLTTESNIVLISKKYPAFALSQSSIFLTFDLKLKITNLREYLIGYFLAFMLGMTEDSIIHKEYLLKNSKYLGYTQYLMYNNNAHILGLLDVKNVNNVEIGDIFKENTFKKITGKEFQRQLNGFKTYVGLYVSKYDFCKDILKCCSNETQILFDDFLSLIDTITVDDIQSLYERVIYDIKEV